MPSPFWHHSHSPLLGLRHWQTPQTRLAPPKEPQPLVDLVGFASLPARLLGNICTAVWEFAALQVTETVLDGWLRVSAEKQGYQKHWPLSTFETGPTLRMGVGVGLYNFTTRQASIGPEQGSAGGSGGQVQPFEAVVEDQLNCYIILAICATAC